MAAPRHAEPESDWNLLPVAPLCDPIMMLPKVETNQV